MPLENATLLLLNATTAAAAPSLPRSNDLWWVGVLLDCVATLGGASGKQLLRHAAVTKNNWFIPLGMFFTAVIDPIFDISAYAFAAQSVIAPMAGMVVVWNVVLAPFTLGEVLTPSRKRGTLLVVLGTACSGFFGNHLVHERTVDEYLALFARPLAQLYYVCFAAVSAVCLYYLRRGSHFWRGFAAGALGGLLAGNMMTTKASVEMVKCVALHWGDAEASAAGGCEQNPFLTPYPYLFITISLALACGALYLLAVGLRSFEALYMITVFEGFMVISGAISGNVVLNEKEGHPPHLMALYFGAVLVILAGLYVLCSGEQQSLANDADGEHNGLAAHDGARPQRPAGYKRGARRRGDEGVAMVRDEGAHNAAPLRSAAEGGGEHASTRSQSPEERLADLYNAEV
uniref:EamA domain-containing protein n=2 Tax=Emiliania huxleyi TaxID=2903 RepID=A0A7S3VXX1_EMIHU|mmetsp:Transcript_11340/g.32726  ORF Transcript_11340/g.32726 Transcript_11340/m.32726 type:complete len:402 (+) Transcript_11340:26-1231(+)